MNRRVTKAVARAQREAEAIEEGTKDKGPAPRDELLTPTPRALERMWKRILSD